MEFAIPDADGDEYHVLQCQCSTEWNANDVFEGDHD